MLKADLTPEEFHAYWCLNYVPGGHYNVVKVFCPSSAIRIEYMDDETFYVGHQVPLAYVQVPVERLCQTKYFGIYDCWFSDIGHMHNDVQYNAGPGGQRFFATLRRVSAAIETHFLSASLKYRQHRILYGDPK